MGVPADLKDSLGNISRIKQLLISHARHRCGHWAFLNINVLFINANVIIKIARQNFYYFSLGLFATKSRHVTNDVNVRDKN